MSDRVAGVSKSMRSVSKIKEIGYSTNCCVFGISSLLRL